jgi:CheY-like chemotaxis protein
MYAIGLLAMGFQPVTAATAEDGFERACLLKPDVIVADVSVAGMSGLDLTRRLRRDERTRGARIIVLAGHALGGVKPQAEAAGCDRFLVKPCLPDVLACEIRHVLLRADGEVRSSDDVRIAAPDAPPIAPADSGAESSRLPQSPAARPEF